MPSARWYHIDRVVETLVPSAVAPRTPPNVSPSARRIDEGNPRRTHFEVDQDAQDCLAPLCLGGRHSHGAGERLAAPGIGHVDLEAMLARHEQQRRPEPRRHLAVQDETGAAGVDDEANGPAMLADLSDRKLEEPVS